MTGLYDAVGKAVHAASVPTVDEVAARRARMAEQREQVAAAMRSQFGGTKPPAA